MKKVFFLAAFLIHPINAKADLWGADLPLLAEIVFNTLHTMAELERQTNYMNDELAGIHDRIERIRTISSVVQPADWEKWKDPREALKRLQTIYRTMPKEYRSDKADTIEEELAKAMNLIARLGPEAKTSFASGKELERRGADASPGVAQKLTASGIGSLIALESQTQVIQSHITSLLAQMLAEANEKETRSVTTKGNSFKSFATNLKQDEFKFSELVFFSRAKR